MGILNMDPFTLFARIVVLFTSMPVHEYAHGWVAHKLGDDTAYYQGRLDLNPLRHLDPLGTVLLLFTGFGWAKPVPVQPRNFTHKITMRGGMALTALAGPMANLLLAFVVLTIYKVMVLAIGLVGLNISASINIIASILSIMVSINVGLAVFNLLPIPPLDGYNILSYFIPAKWDYKVAQFFGQYQLYITLGLLMVLNYTPILDIPLGFMSSLVFKLLNFATGWVDVLWRLLV